MSDLRALHHSLPAAYAAHGGFVSLADVGGDPARIPSPASLEPERLRALLVERMKRGAWQDVYISDELFTLDRALHEIEQNSELGQSFLSIYRRAFEMMLEDAR